MRYLTVILLLLVTNAYGAKVEITSDKFYADDNSSQVFFVDNVVVSKDKDRLFCDLLIVYFNKVQETKKYDASGNVRFEIFREGTHYKGSAKSVEYIVKLTQYTFRGNAVIHDLTSKRNLFGEEIILNSTTGKASVKSSDKRPSKFIFEMEN
ncbi:MAG: lipopolysaccharide transport periplasmic protein LptA [Campylobacterales bacterium]|nr:lipopolysaccharide transport periplasmic protein LptA [Campylobacterales bacterium]